MTADRQATPQSGSTIAPTMSQNLMVSWRRSAKCY
jgi:hypothetical protein